MIIVKLGSKNYIADSTHSDIRSKILESGLFPNLAKAKLLVATFQDKNLIGACGIRGPLNILSLMVDKEYRNNGLAQILLKRIIEEAKKENYDFIMLTVMNKNTTAAHIYKKFGFKKLLEFSTSKGIELVFQIKPMSTRSYIVCKLLESLKTNNKTFNNMIGKIILRIIHHF